MRNPLRASVVEKPADWRWSRLWHRVHGDKEGLLDEGPLTLPSRWRGHVQRGQTEAELEVLRRSVVRGAPFGESSRQERTAKKLGLLFDAPPSAENTAQRKRLPPLYASLYTSFNALREVFCIDRSPVIRATQERKTCENLGKDTFSCPLNCDLRH